MIKKVEHEITDPWGCLSCGNIFEPSQTDQCPNCLGDDTAPIKTESNRGIDVKSPQDHIKQLKTER